MSATDLGEAAEKLMKDARSEWTRLAVLQRHIDGKLLDTWMPNGADSEYRDLLAKAGTPWLGFARDAIAQGCIVNGYTNDAVWQKVWRANGMDGRQSVITREAVGLGKSYALLLPAEPDGDEKSVTVWPMSSLRTFAVFAEPWDEYPSAVLHRLSPRVDVGANYWKSDWYYIDAEAAYRFDGSPATPENVRPVEHRLGFAPVVRIGNTLDPEPQSAVALGITTYKRIVDATFTLQMIQRYGAFPQKWMAGGEVATDADGNALVRPSVDSLLHAKGESGETARFGTFEPADPAKLVNAKESHIRDLSAVLQVPPHYLLGALTNMSADGIAAAESGYHRNLNERKGSLGEGYELLMRTGAAILGDETAATSTTDHVDFENVASWSLNQVADAVSKFDAVGAERSKLLQLVPGWSRADALEAAAGSEERLAARSGADSSSPRQIAELIQKIYLGVGKVLTAEEAREIANRAGAGLQGSLPVPVEPTRAGGDAGTAPANVAG